MRLRVTRPAAAQIERTITYIAEHNPQGASRVLARIQSVMMMLTEQPLAGPPTTRRGERRVLTIPYPYAITYTVLDGEVVILGIRHTGRRPVE